MNYFNIIHQIFTTIACITIILIKIEFWCALHDYEFDNIYISLAFEYIFPIKKTNSYWFISYNCKTTENTQFYEDTC